MLIVFKKHWFLFGLLAVSGITLADSTLIISGIGKWVRAHHGPDIMICLIFFFSGFLLKIDQVKQGLSDIKGTVLALLLIFIAAPIIGSILVFLPLDPAVKAGILLVAVMPTTLSSGVVMSGAAGGNIAHALLITILANTLAIFTVPISLSFLFGVDYGLDIEKGPLMLQIALLVLAPLSFGILVRLFIKESGTIFNSWIPIINQLCILSIVWMALSQARQTVLSGGSQIFWIILLSTVFHGLLLLTAFLSTMGFGIGPGRRESILFMGGQKTLPLSVLFQVKLFPDLGLTLVFCVVHHFVHLMMDSYLVGRLADAARQRNKAHSP